METITTKPRKRKAKEKTTLEDPFTGSKFKVTVEAPKKLISCGEMLPDNCVLKMDIGQGRDGKKNKTLYIIELPKDVYFVRYSVKKYNPNPDEFMLSWPSSLWWLYVREASMYSEKSVSSVGIVATKERFSVNRFDTEIFQFPVPNLGNGVTYGIPDDLCLGCTNFPRYVNTEPQDKAMAKYINEYMATLLGSTWNNGRPPRLELLGITTMKQWHKGTASDPDWFCKTIKWTPVVGAKTVKEVLKRAESDLLC